MPSMISFGAFLIKLATGLYLATTLCSMHQHTFPVTRRTKYKAHERFYFSTVACTLLALLPSMHGTFYTKILSRSKKMGQIL